MDQKLQQLLRRYQQEPTPETAIRLANAMLKIFAPEIVRNSPLTWEEIRSIPPNEDGHIPVSGIVKVPFERIWDGTIDHFFDILSQALVGNRILMNLEYDIVDVDPGDELVIKVSGEVEDNDED